MENMVSPSSPDSIGESTNHISTSNVPRVMAFHPKLAEAIPKIIAECKARGIGDVVIAPEGGIRSPEKQMEEYTKGRQKLKDGTWEIVNKDEVVTNALPWASWHCLGLAIDLCFTNSHGVPFWPIDTSHLWLDLFNVVKMHGGFEWGGNWTKFKGDLDHFQMRGTIPNMHEAKRILFEEGLEAVWKLV